MNAVLFVEENAFAQLAALLVRAMARACVWVLWLILQGALPLLRMWRPLSICAGTVAAVVLCAAVPMLPVGLAIVALVGWVTYPRKRVSWNSGREVSA